MQYRIQRVLAAGFWEEEEACKTKMSIFYRYKNSAEAPSELRLNAPSAPVETVKEWIKRKEQLTNTELQIFNAQTNKGRFFVNFLSSMCDCACGGAKETIRGHINANK